MRYSKGLAKLPLDPRKVKDYLEQPKKIAQGPKKKTKKRVQKGKPDYRTYILSDKWLKKRIGFYAFLKHIGMGKECYACGSKKYKQVHHITYDRLGNESYSDLLALCDGCHEELHTRDSDAEKATEIYLQEVGKSIKEYRTCLRSKRSVFLHLTIPEAEVLLAYILESGNPSLGTIYDKLSQGVQ